MYKDECGSSHSFLIGVITGGVLGVVAAFLIAPMSGKKLRKKISDTAEDIKEEVNDYVESSKELANDLLKDGRKKVVSIINDAKKLVTN